MSEVQYLDATTAKITKDGVVTATIANVATGDTIIAQGTVNGSAVTASTIMDHGAAPTKTASGQPETSQNRSGFLGAIGGFFKHLFGF